MARGKVSLPLSLLDRAAGGPQKESEALGHHSDPYQVRRGAGARVPVSSIEKRGYSFLRSWAWVSPPFGMGKPSWASVQPLASLDFYCHPLPFSLPFIMLVDGTSGDRVSNVTGCHALDA